MGNIVRFEQGVLSRIFEGVSGISTETEEVVHVTYEGNYLVSLHTKKMHAEFSEDYRDPANHGPALRPLMEYLEREHYSTNLK